MVDDLSSQAGQLLVSLFDLLVKSLVLNLELFVIDQVETLSELFLLLEDLLLVGQTVSQSDVLQTVLMDLLIFSLVGFLPFFNNLGAELLASTTVDSVHGHTALELLELLLDLSAFGLLLVKFVLELAGHAVVSVLSLLQVVADLMHVSQSVQVLVLVKHLIALFFVVAGVSLHKNDLALALFVQLLEILVLATLIFNSLDKLTLHRRLTGEVSHTIVVLLVRIRSFLTEFLRLVLFGANERFSTL